jgi:hypothetical protein
MTKWQEPALTAENKHFDERKPGSAPALAAPADFALAFVHSVKLS